MRLYARAVGVAADSTYALYWLATGHEDSGQLELAAEYCDRGLAIDPDQIALLLRRGSIASTSKDHRLALDCYLKAATLDPDIPDVDSMIGDQYCFLGRIREGVEQFDNALKKDPGSTRLQDNRLFVLNYANLLSPEELFDEHRRWGESHEAALRAHWRPHTGRCDPDKVLRVGYVSGDLRNHAVAFFIEPLLAHHDTERFSVVCFDVSRYAEDAVTARLKSHGHRWLRVGHLDAGQLAASVREEGIDVLVDLSGHTDMNRLLVFARRPAPVQATWLGYLGTTGLTSMDYRITDAYLDPPGHDRVYHTERLLPACRTPRAFAAAAAPGGRRDSPAAPTDT